jgi:RNA polymerase sigma factor (sigma-70 family)
MLTPAEELHLGTLVQRWRQWPGGPDEAPAAVKRRGLKARERIATANLRLVWTFALRRRGVASLEDRLQAGAMGVIRAAECFDPARGYKFSTYSFFWIRQAIGCVDDKATLVHIPQPTLQVLRGSRRFDVKQELIDAGARAMAGPVSLEASPDGLDQEDSHPLSELLEGSRLNIDDVAHADALKEAMQAMGAAMPDDTALLQLHHADGATYRSLAGLERMRYSALKERLDAARATLRQLPEVCNAIGAA